jgi:hypothetical protein
MAFRTVRVPVVGESNKHRSSALSAEITMNLIPEVTESGKSTSSLTVRPGTKLFSNSALTLDRGMTVFNGSLYKVSDSTLEKIDSTGARTVIGTIDGIQPCVFANDETQLRIATGFKDYILDTSDNLAVITDPDLQPGNSVAYMNRQMINDANGGAFQVSQVGNIGSIDNLDVATAESAPDDTIFVKAFRERLYLFGTSTIETWYNSGTGRPPFDRVNGGTMPIGLGAVHSVSESPSFVYFLGSDNAVYRFSATQAQRVSNPVITNQIQDLPKTSDAIGYNLQLEGMDLYVLNFISANKTYVLNETNGLWFNISTGPEQLAFFGRSTQVAYGKTLISRGGKVLEFDANTYEDEGSTSIVKERITTPIVSTDGARIRMSRFELIMQTGVGLVSGQGEIPQIMFQASYDGGQTWSDEDWVSVGRMGQGRTKVEWYNMACAYSIQVRMRMSDPVFMSVHSAAIDIEPAGW